MNNVNSLTHKRLLRDLDYNPTTGVFTWKISRQGTRGKGRTAGYVDPKNLRLIIVIDLARYWGDELAWFYMTGNWPIHGIKSIDGDKANNRFENLQEKEFTLK